jgi:hypothetical protein
MPVMTNEGAPPRRRGCFFYGCITLIILMLIAALGTIVGVRFLQRKVQEYADTKPMPIERGDASSQKLSAVQKRIDTFKEAVATQRTPQELALSADEINTLLAGQPDLQPIADRVFVFIENNQLKAKLSWPLDQFGIKGRYFNGTGTFKVAINKGNLDLRIDDVQTQSGKPLPAPFLEELRKHDFADDLQRDAQTAAALQQVDSVEIRDQQLVIRSKPAQQ